ncbi:unnamed protein product, partial [Allacma fusca]
MAFTALK